MRSTYSVSGDIGSMTNGSVKSTSTGCIVTIKDGLLTLENMKDGSISTYQAICLSIKSGRVWIQTAPGVPFAEVALPKQGNTHTADPVSPSAPKYVAKTISVTMGKDKVDTNVEWEQKPGLRK